MLYVSTRNKVDSFTTYFALRNEAAPDGGVFMPMQLPVLSDVQFAQLEQMNFSQAVAFILNQFFGTKITGWDVDFAVGRQALDLVSAGYKISLAESWHNPAGTHAYLLQRLYALVRGEKYTPDTPNLWFQTAVNIAILFGVFGKYSRQEIYEFDVAVESGDLSLLLAIRYAQKMGLPIQKVILGCLDGDGLWEFVSYGIYQTGRKEWMKTFEALLWLEFGYDEAERYHTAVQIRQHYRLENLKFEKFRDGLFASVVGDDRVKNIIDSTMRTNNYQMQNSTARAFGALQDYRAKTGINKNTLLFARKAPVN